MEGFKGKLKKLTNSLRFRLIVISCLIGMLCSAISSYMSYYNFKQDSLDFLDDELRQVAASAINYDMIIPKRWDGPRRRHLRMFGDQAFTLHRNQFLFFNQDLTGISDPIIIAPLYGRSSDNIFIPTGIEDGIYTLILSNTRARVLLATHYDGRRFVVARSLKMTTRMAQNAFISSFVEFVLLTVVYSLLITVSLNLIFKAVTKLSSEISKRTAENLKPFGQNNNDIYIPSELNGFIDAINLLFARIDKTLQNQKRFIADAAHEMRTPLTALSLQVESLSHENLDASARTKVESLKAGIMRERDLMSALLTLARYQNGEKNIVKQNVNIKDLFVSLIEQLGSIADSKNIDFGIEGNADVLVNCSLSDLTTVMNNLCSNALKYTPENGRVDLKCIQNANTLILMVKDTGPGILEEDLTKITEPFYRCGGDTSKHLGTGLGLAIAKASAERLNGQILFANAKDGGLEASLILERNE